MERKSLPITEFKADGGKGEFTAFFSVFDVLDHDGDIVRKGAFLAAFAANPDPAIVWTHNWGIPPIGETLDVDETDKGARGHGRLFVDEHQVAAQVYAGLKAGALKQFSYAYDVAAGGAELRQAKDGESALRPDGMIRELKSFSGLHEWGPTLRGANPLTTLIDSPKSLGALTGLEAAALEQLPRLWLPVEGEEKAVIAFAETPKAPTDTAWNASAEVARADVADLKAMCAWYDASAADAKGSYKLPHHRSDSAHPVVWRGVAAAMGALLGARGGVQIPDADRKGVYNHLAKHYAQFDKEPPQLASYPETELKALFPDVYPADPPDADAALGLLFACR